MIFDNAKSVLVKACITTLRALTFLVFYHLTAWGNSYESEENEIMFSYVACCKSYIFLESLHIINVFTNVFETEVYESKIKK